MTAEVERAPVISRVTLDRIESYVALGVEEGVRFYTKQKSVMQR